MAGTHGRARFLRMNQIFARKAGFHQAISRSGYARGLATPATPTRGGCERISSGIQSSWGRRPASRVLRGGSWNNRPNNTRSANRNRNTPENRNNNTGFRVSSTANRPPIEAGHGVNRSIHGSGGRAAVQSMAAAPASMVALAAIGRTRKRPGGSGRPNGSKAPPGVSRRVIGFDSCERQPPQVHAGLPARRRRFPCCHDSVAVWRVAVLPFALSNLPPEGQKCLAISRNPRDS